MTEDDNSIENALSIARRLVSVGVPVFIAQPDPANPTGYSPPAGWQNTVPDEYVVDRWRPGRALCAVMGHGLDAIDIDPRNGGEWRHLEGLQPTAYGFAFTPSGGAHVLISSLGVAKHTNLLPGIDIQAGAPDGSGRGFIFIAPTVRASKETGELKAYRWLNGPYIERWLDCGQDDTSGEQLRQKILEAKAGSGVAVKSGPDWWQDFLRSSEPQSQPAADRAINEKLSEVTHWSSGSGTGFRTVLLRAALTLGGYVGGGYLEADLAVQKLEAAVSAVWDAPDEDDRLWIDQGLSDGQLLPFHVYTAADMLAFGYVQSGEEFTEEELYTFYDAVGHHEFEAYGMTDQELAESVLERVQPGMRFAVDAGTWLMRHREVWTERAEGSSSAVAALAKVMPLGDPDLPAKKADYSPENWLAVRRTKFLNSGTSSAVEKKMRSVVQITGHAGQVELAKLDSDPHVLWAGGRPYDLRRCESGLTVATHVPLDYPHMHTAWIAPDLSCPTPRWDAFVAAVLPDPEVRAWALRVLSIGLTGYPDAALPILFGRARSGKTSLLEILLTVLGTYGKPANPKLLQSGDSGHDVIVWELKGARMAFIDEGPRRGHDATEKLKQLTGGAKLTGRGMRANPVTFNPTHTLVMTTNVEPTLTDPALQARARLIPCDSPEMAVKPLRRALLDQAVLRAEAPGILAQMMREAALWLADSDSASQGAAPASIRGLAAEIAEGQDPIRAWVLECTMPADPGTPGSELHSNFAEWHQSKALYRRLSVPTGTEFGRTLTEMGYPSVKTKGAWYRPLVVAGVGGGWAQSPPTPSGYMAGRRVTGESGGSVPGLETNPPTPKPQVNPTSSLYMAGMAGLYIYKEGENTHTVEREKREIIGEISRPPANPAEISPLPAETPLAAPASTPPPPAPTRAKSEKAQLKAAERANAREQARLEAVREAGGEVLPLPVVVDRAGHTIPVTYLQANQLITAALLRTDGALTVDVETSGYSVGHKHHKLRSVQLGDEVASVVLDPADEAQRDVIRLQLGAAKTLHAHSASADLVPLAKAGLIDYDAGWAKMHDTVIPAKLGDPKSTGSDPGLKKLASAVLGSEATAPAADEGRERVFKAGKWLTRGKADTPPERLGWAQIDTGCEAMLKYAASDVLDTAALAKRLPPVAGPVLDRERVAEEMTARVAYHGLKIDAVKVDELTTMHQAKRAAAGGHIKRLGITNPGSGPQVAEKLLEMGAQLPCSEKGNPSVAEHVLTLLKRNGGDCGALADLVLTYRHHNTALGLFLEPYELLCRLGDGRARPTVYTLGTDTGRMSCVRPNFQQLPREGGIRSVVVADPGHVLIAADFSGVEIRGAAALSQDPTLLRFLIEGRDLHSEVALQAFGPCPVLTEQNGKPTPRKADRYASKSLVFGRLYGGGVPTLARQAGVTEPEAQRVVDTLDALTPRLSQWSNEMRQAVRQGRTQYPAYSGRIIHFPSDYPHKAPNYAIQGSCRELLVDALGKWRDTKWGTGTLLPVHDELIVQVPEEDGEVATQALVECMQSELYGVTIAATPDEPSKFWKDSV